MCPDHWNLKVASENQAKLYSNNWKKQKSCPSGRERTSASGEGVIVVFTPSIDLGHRGGWLFWVVVLNMTTHRLYPSPLNFNILLLLLFCYPTETQQLATKASCVNSVTGTLPPVRGSRGQTHTKNGQTRAEGQGHGRRPDKWGEKTEERYWSRRMSRSKQSKSEWARNRTSVKRIVGRRRWQGSRRGQIKGKEEWSPMQGLMGWPSS